MYQCPKCKSKTVRIVLGDFVCTSCGYSEPLIDYPVSWDWHRHYCREYGLPDPGPCETLRPESTPEEPSQPQWTKRQWDQVQQLKAQVNFLQKKLEEHLNRPRRKPSKTTLTGIDT